MDGVSGWMGLYEGLDLYENLEDSEFSRSKRKNNFFFFIHGICLSIRLSLTAVKSSDSLVS